MELYSKTQLDTHSQSAYQVAILQHLKEIKIMAKKKVHTKQHENRRATQHEDWNYIKRHGRKAYDAVIRSGQRTV